MSEAVFHVLLASGSGNNYECEMPAPDATTAAILATDAMREHHHREVITHLMVRRIGDNDLG